MLIWLGEYLSQFYSGFNVLQYITVRGILGVLTALIFSFVFGPWMIRKLSFHQIGQQIRDDGPQSHLVKAGTPTMGGTLIITAVTVATLLCANLENMYVWVALLTTLAFGVIGFIDDYKKLKFGNHKGLSPRAKYFWQSVCGFGSAGYLYITAATDVNTSLYFPVFKEVAVPLGGAFVLWGYMVIVGTSNAVNLTDGLDGLAIGPCVMVSCALGVFAYVAGHIEFAQYLGVPYIAGVGELAIVCVAIGGAGLGFLWFNTYPAQVFMGDVGALALGAALGVIALMVKQELVLVIMGGIFVAETVSVVLQVGSYKLTQRRIFRMAPLHHHYELKGWPEPKIIVRFWIITLILVLIGLATLKLR